MKTIKSLLIATLLVFGALATSAAEAHPGHFYGPRVGIYIDPWAAFYPWPYYPYGYYGNPQVIVQQAPAPTVYIEQGQPAQQTTPQTVAPAQSNDWYYCRKPQGYYPYVRNCSEAWQRVPAQPPAQQ